jgi:hypothetical protein
MSDPPLTETGASSSKNASLSPCPPQTGVLWLSLRKREGHLNLLWWETQKGERTVLVCREGAGIPVGLKVFLYASAIADDLGAVLVIALFYAQSLVWSYPTKHSFGEINLSSHVRPQGT